MAHTRKKKFQDPGIDPVTGQPRFELQTPAFFTLSGGGDVVPAGPGKEPVPPERPVPIEPVDRLALIKADIKRKRPSLSPEEIQKAAEEERIDDILKILREGGRGGELSKEEEKALRGKIGEAFEPLSEIAGEPQEPITSEEVAAAGRPLALSIVAGAVLFFATRGASSLASSSGILRAAGVSSIAGFGISAERSKVSDINSAFSNSKGNIEDIKNNDVLDLATKSRLIQTELRAMRLQERALKIMMDDPILKAVSGPTAEYGDILNYLNVEFPLLLGEMQQRELARQVAEANTGVAIVERERKEIR